MDAYRYARFDFIVTVITCNNRKGLTAQQAEFATKKYKQHRRVGTVAEVLEAIRLQDERKKALANL